MLHYILAQVSIQLISKSWKRIFRHSEVFLPATLGSHFNRLVIIHFNSLLSPVGFQPCFSPGGACFSHVFPEVCSPCVLAFNWQFDFCACLPFSWGVGPMAAA